MVMMLNPKDVGGEEPSEADVLSYAFETLAALRGVVLKAGEGSERSLFLAALIEMAAGEAASQLKAGPSPNTGE